MKKRLVSLDILRIVAMFMIVLLHVQSKTGWLNYYSIREGNWYMRWIIESLSICAVNIYVLISGFLLADSKFAPSRIITLLLRTLFWSLIIFFVYCLFGGEIDVYVVLGTVFPFSYSSYWFLTTYIGMIVFAPVLIFFFKRTGKHSHLVFCIILVLLCSILPTILPLSKGISGISGTGVLWFLTLFSISSYIKFYFNVEKIQKRRWVLLVVYFSLVSLKVILYYLFSYSEIEFHALGSLSTYFFNYSSFVVFGEALCLFLFAISFTKSSNTKATFILSKVSFATFGVYLIHENPLIRQPLWWYVKTIFDGSNTTFAYVGAVLLIGLAIFAVTTILELIRYCLFDKLEFFLSTKISDFFSHILNKLTNKIEGVKDEN